MWKLNEYRYVASTINNNLYVRPLCFSTASKGYIFFVKNTGGIRRVTFTGGDYCHNEYDKLDDNYSAFTSVANYNTANLYTGYNRIQALGYDSGQYFYAIGEANGQLYLEQYDIDAVDGSGPTNIFLLDNSKTFFETYHDICVVGNRIYYIQGSIYDQLNDIQYLWYFDLATLTSHQACELNIKQIKPRSMVLSRKYDEFDVLTNEDIYISSYNGGQVIKVDTINLHAKTNITVNRDVELLKKYGNLIYVQSSNQGRITVAGTEDPSLELVNGMISTINVTNDSVTHVHGVINGAKDFAVGTNHLFAINLLEKFQITKKSDNKTYVNVSTITDIDNPINSQGAHPVYGADYAISTDAETFLYQPGENPTQLKFICLCPSNDNNAERIFIITANYLQSMPTTYPLKWVNTFNINQYTSVSAGALAYKDD